MPSWPELILPALTVFLLAYSVKLKHADRQFRRKLYRFCEYMTVLCDVQNRFPPDHRTVVPHSFPEVVAGSKPHMIPVYQGTSWGGIRVTLDYWGLYVFDDQTDSFTHKYALTNTSIPAKTIESNLLSLVERERKKTAKC